MATLKPTMADEGFEELAAEVDRAIAAADRLDASARRVALDLKAALERFHKTGLSAIVAALRADAHGKALLFDLVDEPSVRALLSLHGLIRLPAEAAPQPPAAPAPQPAAPTAVIPLSALKARPGSGWIAGPRLADLDEIRPHRIDVAEKSVVVIRAGGEARAYRNECAHQGLPIDGGIVDVESGTITCPWHGFRFDCASGECLTAPHVQLEPVPVRVDEGTVYVRVE